MWLSRLQTACSFAVVLFLIRSSTSSFCWVESFVVSTPTLSTNEVKMPVTTIGPTRYRRSRLYGAGDSEEDEKKKGPFSFFMDPYESKIPEGIRKEIYAAEANTEAARNRNQRIGLYALAAFAGVAMAVFNAFLSELRVSETPDGLPFDLNDSPFAWVDSNFVYQLLFINKIGGLLALLGGAAAGLLAEAEFDTRRLNAEKIYQELLRRREARERAEASAPDRKKNHANMREYKRMGALAELLDDDDNDKEQSQQTASAKKEEPVTETMQPMAASKEASENKPGGIMDSMKEFYKKADNMAASQALMLNKQLEDAGVLEKITDETGMRIVGKEEAAKIASKDKDTKSTKQQ